MNLAGIRLLYPCQILEMGIFMICRIADFVVELNCGSITSNNAQKYIIDSNVKTDFSIVKNTERARRRYPDALNDEIADYLWEGTAFCIEMLKRGAMRLHSSAVVVDDKAYLFSAPCGTGKSTHTNLWLDLFGKRAYILNDDKPALRILNNTVYAYGTPWSGKHDISVNRKVKLQGICFLQRDNKNWIHEISKEESVPYMLSGCLKRLDFDSAMQQLDIISQIIDKVPIYLMGCTPTIDAAKTSYSFMSKGDLL